MILRQVSQIPHSLVCIKGQSIATYDTVAFLNTRAQDLGGRKTAAPTRGHFDEKETCHLEIAIAIGFLLASLSFIVFLLMKLLYF